MSPKVELRLPQVNENMSNSSSTDMYIVICYNVEVHVTEKTVGSVISDIVVCFLSLLLAFISIGSNALVLRVYLKTTCVKTSGNLLLVSLSTLELLKSILIQTTFVVWKVLEISSQDFCFFYLFTILANNFCSISSLLLTCFLITIERYLSVFRPIFHRKPIVKRAFKLAVIITELMVAFLLLFTFFTSHHRTYFTAAYLIIITSLTTTAIVYIKIRAKMRRTPICGSQASDLYMASKQAGDRRMNNTVISIIIFSVVCYMPLFAVLVYISLHARTAWHTRYIVPWAYLLTFCTAAFNPFIYCWKNRRLRSEMLKITKKVLATKHRTSQSSMASSNPTTNAATL